MKPYIKHPWPVSKNEALELQIELSHNVINDDKYNIINLVAGVDVAYDKDTNKLVAAVVILNSDTLNVVETVTVDSVSLFPYIPGLFSFRELPPIIKAFDKLKNTPDLVVCDGQGIAHPRNFGLACHLGVIFDIPTIGCGKTRLIGEYKIPGISRGSVAPLIFNDKIIGNVLRTQNNIKPVFISIGHRISLASACEWILKLTPRYRLPETTRYADQAVRKALKALTTTSLLSTPTRQSDH